MSKVVYCDKIRRKLNRIDSEPTCGLFDTLSAIDAEPSGVGPRTTAGAN